MLMEDKEKQMIELRKKNLCYFNFYNSIFFIFIYKLKTYLLIQKKNKIVIKKQYYLNFTDMQFAIVCVNVINAFLLSNHHARCKNAEMRECEYAKSCGTYKQKKRILVPEIITKQFKKRKIFII